MGLFDIFKRKSTEEKNPYLDTVLPNGKTIRQQQETDLKHAMGVFEEDVPVYLDMHIVASTVPPKQDYAVLNSDEKKFLSEFQKLLIQNKYDPKKIKLTRMSNGGFNVEYTPLAYVGKFSLYREPVKYSVKKPQNKNATKKFDTMADAEEFAKTNKDYEIIASEPVQHRFIQYSIGMKAHDETPDSVDEMIAILPKWIKYLNYCKRN